MSRANPSHFWHESARLEIEVNVCQCARNSPVLTPSEPRLRTRKPGRHGRVHSRVRDC